MKVNMKQNTIHLLYCIIYIGCFISCSNNSNVVKKRFTTIDSIKIDSIEIPFILHPIRWHINNEMMLVYNPKVKPSIHIFDLEAKKLFASYDIIGHGPNEFSFPGVSSLKNEKEIALYQEQMNKFVIYSITDSVLEEKSKFKFPKTDQSYLYSRCFEVKDSIFLGVSFTPQSTFCQLLDFKNNNIVSTLPIGSINKNLDNPYIGSFSYKDSILAVGFELIDAIMLYKLVNNKFVPHVNIGENILSQQESIENLQTIYYSDIICSDGYIFALLQNCNENSLFEKKSKIEVYDTKGNSLKCIDLKQPISQIVWNDATKEILGYNPLVDENILFVYKIADLFDF